MEQLEIEWGWGLTWLILCLAAAAVVYFHMTDFFYRKLDIKPNSAGERVARLSPPYVAFLIVLLGLDLFVNTLHLPPGWNALCKFVLAAAAVADILMMLKKLREETERAKYGPTPKSRTSPPKPR